MKKAGLLFIIKDRRNLSVIFQKRGRAGKPKTTLRIPIHSFLYSHEDNWECILRNSDKELGPQITDILSNKYADGCIYIALENNEPGNEHLIYFTVFTPIEATRIHSLAVSGSLHTVPSRDIRPDGTPNDYDYIPEELSAVHFALRAVSLTRDTDQNAR